MSFWQGTQKANEALRRLCIAAFWIFPYGTPSVAIPLPENDGFKSRCARKNIDFLALFRGFYIQWHIPPDLREL